MNAQHTSTKWVKNMPVEVKIRKGESVDKALRRLKRILDRENILKDARTKCFWEPPCAKRRRKKKVAAFNSMLRHKRSLL